jgi:hypothetical protein
MTELFPGYIPPTRQEEDAEAIYQAYPRHEGKKPAKRKIRIALEELEKRMGDDAFPFLLGKVLAYREATAKWPKAERCFIPHPATWFGQGRYEDDPRLWQRGEAKEIEFL